MNGSDSQAGSLPDPVPVLDLIEAFRRSKTMFAAVALGVFDRLGESPVDAATLAAQIGARRDALERLLDACVALGFLRKQGGVYSNLPVAGTYLRRKSPHTMTGYILYSNKALYPMWGNLEDAVREGTNRWQQSFGFQGSLFDHFFRTEESRREFIAGMHGFGLISSPRVVEAFDLSRFRRLVDLGGATGHLAVAAASATRR
jgi:Dimerisation domain/O-methyltransferase domain